MAKKKGGFLKAAVGIGAAVVASKVAYDKYKETKEKFSKEEQDSLDLEIRKYNSIFDKKIVEIEDEEFLGCEVKAIGSKLVLDLGLAVFEKDVYINFESIASSVTIILPEGVNVTCDIDRKLAGVRNLVDNVEEDGIHTVYIIGKAVTGSVEVIPVNFYVDDDMDDEDDFDDDEIFANKEGADITVINKSEETSAASNDKKKEDKKEDKKESSESAETISLEEV